MLVQSFHPLGTLLRNTLPGGGDDIAAVIVQDRAEIDLAPTDDLQICEVRLPELVYGCGLVFERARRLYNDEGWAGDQIARPQDPICRSL
jgi:hypothetical protein